MKYQQLAELSDRALLEGVSPILVVMVLATNHRSRLEEMYRRVAKDLLAAHHAAEKEQSFDAIRQRARLKPLMDLIRLRLSGLNTKRPGFVGAWAEGMQATLATSLLRIAA